MECPICIQPMNSEDGSTVTLDCGPRISFTVHK